MSKQLEWACHALGEVLPVRSILCRGGRPLLALPRSNEAASRALDLYQPQRGVGKRVAALLRGGSRFGLHRLLLPLVGAPAPTVCQAGLLPADADRESVGILFGSPAHRVFRAVLSYRNGPTWEVAKLAAGKEGAAMLEHEAEAMRAIGATVTEMPELLGLETNGHAWLLRMPYLRGRCLSIGDVAPVLRLLESWLADEPMARLDSFAEWRDMVKGFGEVSGGNQILVSIADLPLRPSVRHGDLARWNLMRTDDGRLKVLDWEWGEQRGLSGVDLVHYLAQDFRLVRRMPAAEALKATLRALESPDWKTYLDRTGWGGHTRELLIAHLAFKQGAGHQDNREILEVAVKEGF